MTSILNKKIFIAVVIFALFLGTFAAVVSAEHSWGNYHWGRTANPFTLELGNNVSNKWMASLNGASTDWSASGVLDTVVASGKAKRNCKATDGRVEVCSNGYGYNGWLGVAQIWISGDHITKGVVKVNDTYFDSPSYTSAWRNMVMCQEIGHTLGLGHVDEDFTNTPLGTCMDYSSNPEPNQTPNGHDYEMLASIYAHFDTVNTVGPKEDDGGGKGNGKGGGKGKPDGIGNNVDLNNPSAWGEVVSEDASGNNSLYEQNLGNGKKLFTFVIWAN